MSNNPTLHEIWAVVREMRQEIHDLKKAEELNDLKRESDYQRNVNMSLQETINSLIAQQKVAYCEIKALIAILPISEQDKWVRLVRKYADDLDIDLHTGKEVSQIIT
tara:strand:+ start:1882 stop:2202 length:321 start_codon:yes stop_codon:yes gene_type:complete